ncbi:FAD-dependent oxidoreductase [Actinoallomurus sp. NBC_01490]|uniref:FAD-dependent oxidoreductase n=1 Tax=Actinoallomurus sp. NBC_01490 TaxID=2903557 RepID=UPI002E318FAA|nr:FAD-dependent oxidoreductase [Actinoallomurus sp. NBC_01490]
MAEGNDVFDVIVIGAGPVGENAAARVVRGGLTAAVVEERLVGGECNYYACVPSKALLWPMELAAEVDRMPGLGLRGPIEAPAVFDRRDEAVSHFDDGGYVNWLEKLPATKRLIVIGGGPVACEMTQALHALGAVESTVLVREDHLLTRTEPFAGEPAARSLAESGIDLHFGRSLARVERQGTDGPVMVQTDDGSRFEADEILVATGRRLGVHDIGLETVGMRPDGPIEVDASMRATAVPDGRLYAVGDVNGLNLLTHMGKYQARICGDVIAARRSRPPARSGSTSCRSTASEVRTVPAAARAGRGGA